MRTIRGYLKHKLCLRGQTLDRGELKRLARACGLSPQKARGELRRLGYGLSKNSYGLPIRTLPKADRSECKAVRPKAKRTCDGGCCPH